MAHPICYGVTARATPGHQEAECTVPPDEGSLRWPAWWVAGIGQNVAAGRIDEIGRGRSRGRSGVPRVDMQSILDFVPPLVQ
jgi:hypothetical protein